LPSSDGFCPGGTVDGLEQGISPVPAGQIAPEFPKGAAFSPSNPAAGLRSSKRTFWL
jgi:hypothetical protein